MTTQRLKAVVTLGGTVDNSLGSMVRQFEQSTRRMNRETGSLTRQQERLAARIKKAVLAGKDVSQLTRDYQRLSVRIQNAADEAKRLGDLSERGARSQERLANSLRQTGTAAGGIGVAMAGFTAAMTMTNRNTAELEGIASGYDMSVEAYKMWDGIARRMGDGFDGTKIGDLSEELSNKFGEFKNLGEESAFDEVAKALSLDTEKMKGLKTYDQFLYVMQKLEKVTDKQQAATLADKLFGGDGNRVLMWLRNSGYSIDELMTRQKKMILLTDEGRAGAKKFNDAFSSFTSTFGTAWEEIAGIVGGQVAPMLEKTASDFAKWFSEDANKSKLVEGFKEAGRQIRDVGYVIRDIAIYSHEAATALGGWHNVAKVYVGFMAGKFLFSVGSAAMSFFRLAGGFRTAAVAARGFGVALMTTPIGWITAIASAAYLLWENWDWVCSKLGAAWDYLGEKWNALFGDGKEVSVTQNVKKLGVDEFTNNAESRIQAAVPADKSSVTNNIGEIKVYTKEGQSPESFGQAIYEKFKSQKFYDEAEAY